MCQNINKSGEVNKDLDQFFSLLESFSEEFPKYFFETSLQDVQNDIRILMKDWFNSLSDEHLVNLYALFSDELYKFKIKESFNPSVSPLEVSNLFYQIREKVAKIPKILEKRILIQWVKDDVKNTLVEYDFHLRRKLISEERTLFFVQTPMNNYYFINPNPQKGEKIVFAYGGENFKGYKFEEEGKNFKSYNRIYQFTQKIPWHVEEIQHNARGFSSIHCEASLRDFLVSFISPEVLKKVEQVLFLDYPLDAIIEKLPDLIHKLNIFGFQEEKVVLYLENTTHKLSFMGEWKNVSSPQKAEKGFHGQEAVVFNVEKLYGEKGILVTNGNQTEYISL